MAKKKKDKSSKKTSSGSKEYDDEEEEEYQDKSKRPGKGKPKSKRGIIITIVLIAILILVIVVIGFWGFSGEKGYMTTTDLSNNKDDHIGKTVEVKGTVAKNSIDEVGKTFVITDGDSNINITYADMLPANFKEEIDVVVKGTLTDQNGLLVIEAEEIVVGCPSKY